MAIPPRITSTPISTVSSTVRGFVPPTITSDNLVDVCILFRKSDQRSSILQNDSNGKQTRRILGQLVGVVLPLLDVNGHEEINDKEEVVTVCYPGAKLPPIGSVGFAKTMAMGTGIFLESIWEGGIQMLRDLAEQNLLMGITVDQINDATAKGDLGTLLGTKGKYIRSLVNAEGKGVFETIELTVQDVMSGEKTLSLQLLGDQAEAFSDSYERLVQAFDFTNVAIMARISPTVSVTQLGENISYTPNETHFHWERVTVSNRIEYMLDRKQASSGRPYSVSSVNATDAKGLAQRSTQNNYNGQSRTVGIGSATREAAKTNRLRGLLDAGKVTVDDMSLV